MASPRAFGRAPIAEALVDIRALAQKPIASAETKLRDAMRASYPKFATMKSFESAVEMRPDQPPIHTASDKGVQGYVFHAMEHGQDANIIQFRMDGYTYNRLPPYTSGQAMIAEALRWWPLHVAAVAPGEAKRLALRYINRVTGLAREEYRDLLTNPPKPPSGAPGSVEGFKSQMSTGESDGLGSVVATALEGAVDGSYTLTLDIDVFLNGSFGTDPALLAPKLERLRSVKNDLFFAAITDRAAARFE